MKASISHDVVAKTLTITVSETDWEARRTGDFYRGEVAVQELLNVVGCALTTDLLRQHEVTTERWEHEGHTYYRKEASVGRYQTLQGEIALTRHLYQTSAGGATVCPLELKAGLQFGSATPRLAEVVGFKVASATPREVAQDLVKSLGVTLSASYLSEVAQGVGAQALQRRATRVRALPDTPVSVVATGVAGAVLKVALPPAVAKKAALQQLAPGASLASPSVAAPLLTPNGRPGTQLSPQPSPMPTAAAYRSRW